MIDKWIVTAMEFKQGHSRLLIQETAVSYTWYGEHTAHRLPYQLWDQGTASVSTLLARRYRTISEPLNAGRPDLGKQTVTSVEFLHRRRYGKVVERSNCWAGGPARCQGGGSRLKSAELVIKLVHCLIQRLTR